MTFSNPDFTQYAQSYGARGVRVDDIGDFAATLESAFSAGGVHLISLPHRL